MFVRKKSVKLGAVVVAGSVMALTGFASANADTPGYFDAGSYHNTTTAMVGVGSDTIQWVTDDLSKAYDDKIHDEDAATAGTADNPWWISASACEGTGTGPNPDGTGFPCSDGTTTPGLKRDDQVVDSTIAAGTGLANGSGSARTLLTNSSDPLFNDIAYARSSGPAGSTDLSNGEIAMPFALDTISIAVSPNGPAPASLTGDQVFAIFTGAVTNWKQVGGQNAPIHAYIPKTGSSTRGAFLSFMSNIGDNPQAPGDHASPAVEAWASATWKGSQLTGTEVTDPTNLSWKSGTVSVEEHDPTLIMNDVDAIEPFSLGRAEMANGGVGSATQFNHLVRIEGGWSADRALYDVVRGRDVAGADTTPWLWGSDGGQLEKLFGPTGYICSDDATSIIADDGFWQLPSGQCGVANPNPVDPAGLTGVGKAPNTTTKVALSSDKKSVVVTVTSADDQTPAGNVSISLWNTSGGSSFSASGTLSGGKATIAVPANAPAGTYSLGAIFTPTDRTAFNQSSTTASAADGSGQTHDLTVQITKASTVVKKVATVVKAKAKPKKLAKASKVAKVTVTVVAKSGKVKPTGSIKIMRGKKVVGKGKLKGGKLVIKIKGKKLKKGKNKLKVKYTASGNFIAGKAATVTITRKK